MLFYNIFFLNSIKVVKCSSAFAVGSHMEGADLPVSHCQYFWFILVDSSELQLCRRSLKRSTVGQQTCGALLSCSGSWWPERCHLPTFLTWKLAWRSASLILLLASKLVFAVNGNKLYFQMFVCVGPQVALEGLRPTIPPGISPHICKLMKICMNEDPAKRPKFDMIVPILEKMQDKWSTLCAWTSHTRWWCGAYQYCLKLLHCCCIQSHCSSCFTVQQLFFLSFLMCCHHNLVFFLMLHFCNRDK